MSRAGIVLRGVAPLVIAFAALAPGAASPPPSLGASPPCVSGNPTLDQLVLAAGDDYAGPVVTKYETEPMLASEAALDCYGGRTLRFTAYVREPGEVGWTYTYSIEPGWFRTAGSLFVTTDAETRQGEGPFTALAVPPDAGELQAKHTGHWVVVTGHFDDAAAQTCVASGEPGVAPTAAEAVTICRATFVVEAVARTTAPATATLPGVDVAVGSGSGIWIALAGLLGGALGFLRLRRR